MSILERNADRKEKNKNVVVTGRIPEDVYEKFKAICDATGYTVSEAIRVLVVNEVHPKKESMTQRARPKAETPAPEIARTEVVEVPAPVESRVEQPRPIPRFNPTATNFGRFTTNRWKVNNMLPCPACGEWVSVSNFSRHAKDKHGSTTKEIFTTYPKEADEMVEALKAIQ